MFLLNMHSIATFVFVYLFVISSGHEINYCGSKMCGYTNAHTLCQFSFGQSPSCIGYIAARLTPTEKTRIVARLNRRRDDVASGKLQGLPSAGNMLKLRWVDELAREAQMWADQCRLPRTPEEHDACRDLYSVSVGQCIASVVGEAPGLRVESMVDIWFMQNKLYKGNITMYEPPDPSKQFYGDFAQILWARTYMVGCGRSHFMELLRGSYRTVERLVCNFAPQGPAAYRPMWMLGVPAAACPSRSRRHSIYTSLCDYHNEMNQLNDIDNSMTLEEHVLLNAVLEIESNQRPNMRSLDDIYLTYLAIVTMQSADVTTSRFNSIQKRDVVEKIKYEEVPVGTDLVGLSKLNQILNRTTETQPTIFAKVPKKKLNIIGRPKAYIIEELSDVGDKTEKHYDVTEAMSKRKKEFYDYLMETSDETLTLMADEIKFDKDENENLEDHSYVTVITLPEVQVTVADQTDKMKSVAFNKKEIVQETMGTYLVDTTAAYNVSLVTKDKLDDYLADPETVSQLAAALARMERQANFTRKSGKSRREIRDNKSVEPDAQEVISEIPDIPNDITLLSDNEVLTTLNPKEEQNTTDDRAPMINMVLKYMPYLKPYENDLKSGQNSANCLRPLNVLIMIIQFV